MPVHDYVISNATGATIRADLNNALSAIVTNNSSNSEPATKYAYMWWADTSAGLLKIRNSSNDGWVTLFQLDGTLTLEDGSNSAPAIGFRDDDNTGIFSSAADNLDITTGGTTRVNVSSAGINVTGTVTDDGASHDGDVTFIGASANINFDKSDNALEFADNAKAVFGNSDDLKIYHDSSDSYVQDSGTGKLVLATNGASVNIYDTANSAQLAKFITGGAVELYHNGSKKFETTSYGGIFGNDTSSSTASPVRLSLGGTYHSSVGGDPKLSIWTNGTHHMGFGVSGNQLDVILTEDVYDFVVYGGSGTTERFRVYGDGTGIQLPDSSKALFGAGSDLQIYHDGTTSRLHSVSKPLLIKTIDGYDLTLQTNSENAVVCKGNAAVELYYNNAKKFETTSTGMAVTGDVTATGEITASGNGITISGSSASLTLTDDGDDPDYRVQNNNGQFRIFDYTNSANRFSINSSGVVDIAGRLDANGGAVVTGDLTTTGNLTISSTVPTITFTDTDNNPDFTIKNDNGNLRFRDETNSSTRLKINSDGHVDVLGNLDVGAGIDVTGDVNPTGNLNLPDSSSSSVGRIILGDDDDLQIYHDSTQSVIKDSGTGQLLISGENTVAITNAAATENYARFINNGAVELYHDNVKRVETSADGLNLPDNSKLQLGNNQDLVIYHDSAHSYIDNALNDLFIRNTSDDIIIQAQDDFFIRVAGGENAVVALDNGAVELYHNNVKRCETSADGLDLPDNSKLQLGDSQDLQLFHNGSQSVIKDNGTGQLLISGENTVAITNAAATENYARFLNNGAVELFYDNTKRFETLTDGVNVIGTLKINGSAISTGGLGNVVEDTTPQLGGALDTNSQNIEFGDVGNTSQNRLKFGAGGDLSIFHNASTSKNFISTIGSNDLSITSRRVDIKNDDDSETLASFIKDGAVELYYDNSKKFETTTFGATVQGGITFGSDTATANQMDDYEEGVFTPSLEFGGATTDITYSSMRGGSYTKIGRQVTVNFGFTLTSKGSASGDATIAGLPFAIEDLLSSTTAEASGVSCFWNDIATNSANIVFVAMGGTSELEIRNTVGAEDDTDTMVDGDFGNSTAIRGSITYFTAT